MTEFNGWTPVELIYPEDRGGWVYAQDYRPLLESFGYIIPVYITTDSGPGDILVLFRDQRYSDLCGALFFGFGDCPGCDALMSCVAHHEIAELRQDLHDSIKWGTSDNIQDYIKRKDWKITHYEPRLVKAFKAAAAKYFAEWANAHTERQSAARNSRPAG